MQMRPFHRVAIIASLLASPLPAAGSATPGNDVLQSEVVGLVDQNRHTVGNSRFDHKIVILNFIFTSCGSVCPMQTVGLVQLDRSLPPAVRAKVRFVSISVDPLNDDPARLRAYAREMGADTRRWSFLTGPADQIARVTRLFAVFRPSDATGGNHTSEVRLFDGQHRMIQRYFGAPLASDHLRRDIMTLAAMQG